ncbi:MAG: nitroreductase family protein [Candidatus Helarchaeota archaeon]
MDFYKILNERKSIRKFKPTLPANEIIKKIIQKATLSPNAHNCQPWKFIILKNTEIKNKLISKMSEKYKTDLIKDGKSSGEIDKLINHSIRKFSQPPILVIPCLNKKMLQHYDDEERTQNENILGIQSVSSAITYLILAASAEGLGSCWYCAALFAKEIIQKHLNLDIDLVPQAIIAIGYPDENPKKPKRKPLNEVLIEI